jgi:hypothetical protein
VGRDYSHNFSTDPTWKAKTVRFSAATQPCAPSF